MDFCVCQNNFVRSLKHPNNLYHALQQFKCLLIAMPLFLLSVLVKFRSVFSMYQLLHLGKVNAYTMLDLFWPYLLVCCSFILLCLSISGHHVICFVWVSMMIGKHFRYLYYSFVVSMADYEYTIFLSDFKMKLSSVRYMYLTDL